MKTSVGLKGIENPAECCEQLRLIREAGFDAIDINLATEGARQVMNAPDAEKKADEIRSWIADAGLEIGQGHAPFNPYVYGNPEKGNAVIRDIHACFPFAARLGVRDLVVHPMRPRDTADPFFLNPAELIDRNVVMLSAMVRGEEGILPAYHMSKVHWITVLLDGTADDDRLRFLIRHSFELTKSKKRK